MMLSTTQYFTLFLLVWSLCCWISVIGYATTTISSKITNNGLSGRQNEYGVSETTVPTSITSPITESSFCSLNTSADCPDGYSYLDENTCLYVAKTPDQFEKCENFEGGRFFYLNELTEDIKLCLLKAMQERSPKKIRLRDNMVFDLQANTSTVRTNQYYAVCYVRNGSAPVITSFDLEIHDYTQGKKSTVNLLINNHTVIVIDESMVTLTFTCRTSASPGSKTHISSRNFRNRQFSLNDAERTIETTTCRSSGTYGCDAVNVFGYAQIQTEILIKQSIKFTGFWISNSDYFSPITVLDNIVLNCEVRGCPIPRVLSIARDRNASTEMVRVHANTTVSYKLRSVQCSDMGTYYCLAELESGDISETTVEAEIQGRCVVQLCRDETASKIIFAALGQTVSLQVCLMSYESLSTAPEMNTSKVNVTLTRQTDSRVYFTASITIYDIQQEDYKTHVIGIRNYYGTLFYNIRINPKGSKTEDHFNSASVHTPDIHPRETTTKPQVPPLETLPSKDGIQTPVYTDFQDPTSQSWVDFLTTTFPIMSLNVLLILVLCAVIYFYRDPLRSRMSNSSRPAYKVINKRNDPEESNSLCRTQL